MAYICKVLKIGQEVELVDRKGSQGYHLNDQSDQPNMKVDYIGPDYVILSSLQQDKDMILRLPAYLISYSERQRHWQPETLPIAKPRGSN